MMKSSTELFKNWQGHDRAIKDPAEGKVLYRMAMTLQDLKWSFKTKSPLFFNFALKKYPAVKNIQRPLKVENNSDSLASACLSSALNF